MKFWRGIAHVFFGLSLIASFVGVIYGASIFFEHRQEEMGFVVLIGGFIVVLVAHTLFGMFIELCDNVAALRSSNGTNADDTVEKKAWSCLSCGAANESEALFCSECGNRRQ